MFNRNADIKRTKGNVPNWAIAEKLGIHENTFCRWLRTEMSADRKKLVSNAIEEIKKEMNQETLGAN